jgi:hypothetical protein
MLHFIRKINLHRPSYYEGNSSHKIDMKFNLFIQVFVLDGQTLSPQNMVLVDGLTIDTLNVTPVTHEPCNGDFPLIFSNISFSFHM